MQVAQGRLGSRAAKFGLSPSGSARSAGAPPDFSVTPTWETAKTGETGFWQFRQDVARLYQRFRGQPARAVKASEGQTDSLEHVAGAAPGEAMHEHAVVNVSDAQARGAVLVRGGSVRSNARVRLAARS